MPKPKTASLDSQKMKPSSNLEYLALFSENCIRCKSLTETGTETFKECHHSNGNDLCPAAEVRIVVTGEANSYAKRVLRARDQRKPKLEARLMKEIAERSPAFRSKFYDALDGKNT